MQACLLHSFQFLTFLYFWKCNKVTVFEQSLNSCCFLYHQEYFYTFHQVLTYVIKYFLIYQVFSIQRWKSTPWAWKTSLPYLFCLANSEWKRTRNVNKLIFVIFLNIKLICSKLTSLELISNVIILPVFFHYYFCTFSIK